MHTTTIRFYLLAFACATIELFATVLHAQKKDKVARPMNALSNFATSNQFIWANVDGATGSVSVLLPPGTIFASSLDFPHHSFFTCSINGKFFTNNSVIDLPANANLLVDGTTVKIADTIRTTWLNKNGVDIIQDIYPVAFTKSGQIVFKWKFKNNNGTPAAIGCQFLHDIQITDPNDKKVPNSNDGPIILTKWEYLPVWLQYPNLSNGQGVPSFFIGFLHDLPNAPQFFPNLSGQGNLDFPLAPLNLIKPIQITIGDWATMASNIFGAKASWPVNSGTPIGPPSQNDNGILIEFSPQFVTSGKTVEIGRTSYGTGEFETCVGQLTSLVFYPHHIVLDTITKTFSPNPVHIEKYVVNPPSNVPIANAKITLTVGDDMTLVDSLCSKPIGKSQTLPDTNLGVFIPVGGVAYLDWRACVSPPLFCTGPDIDTLLFKGTSSLGVPTFLNSIGNDECDQLITIDCAEADVDAPEFTDTVIARNSQGINVHDWRTTDRGLQSITYTPVPGTDSTKFIIQPITPPIGPCFSDKLNHTVKITQKDSTMGGCFDFTLTDCLGHQSFTTLCLQAHPLQTFHPDSLPPVFTFIKASGSRNASACANHVDSFRVTDSRLRDSGMCSLDTISGSAHNMFFTKTSFTSGFPNVGFTVGVIDSLFDGDICIRASDCAVPSHSVDTCFHYCAPIAGSVNGSNTAAFALEANHPNPFSHLTTFTYTIPEYGAVRLTLYDELGREISKIINEVKQQGTYSIEFDGSKLPGGNYIVRLESSEGVISRKVAIER